MEESGLGKRTGRICEEGKVRSSGGNPEHTMKVWMFLLRIDTRSVELCWKAEE